MLCKLIFIQITIIQTFIYYFIEIGPIASTTTSGYRPFLVISVLGSKTLGTKCIRTSMCNVLANHDQNLKSRFRLLKVCLYVKLESNDCRIYWTKSTRLDRFKIRLDRSNLVRIVFSVEFPTQPKPI